VSGEEEGAAPACTHDGAAARQRLELCSGEGDGAGRTTNGTRMFRGVVRRGWGAQAVAGRSGGMGSSWRRQWWARRRREGKRPCVRMHGKPRALKGSTMTTQRCTPH
jgi:hypothetical protein